MELTNVTLNAYKTSVIEESQEITGTFIITDTVRNGRTQIVDKDSQKKYWVDSIGSEAEVKDLFEEPELVGQLDKEEEASPHLINEAPINKHVHPQKTIIATHIVSRGDTTQTIARLYGVSESHVISCAKTTRPSIGSSIIITKE